MALNKTACYSLCGADCLFAISMASHNYGSMISS